MRASYEYSVNADGQLQGAATSRSCATASLSLDGLQSTTWLGPFSPTQRDLLRVMAGILMADRLSPRRLPGGRRAERELAWQRSISLRVAVESAERWAAAAPLVARLLSFMTDDAWVVSFERIRARPAQQILPFGERETVTEVALFSGGLDSVAGLFSRWLAAPNSNVLAVSACGNEVRGSAQATALGQLRRLGVRARWLKLDHQQLGSQRSRNAMEASQRSRALLFLAMGAVAAYEVGLPTFSVYETGIGGINLPTSSAQVGAQGTRAMHPRTLALFNQLVALVLDRPARAVAPFFLHTKGELCHLSGSAIRDLAAVSMSCDEGEGHKPDSMLHCGLCTSCLFRRIALHHRAGGADPTRYRDIATRRHGAYEVQAFENHARDLNACRSFRDLISLDPDVRFASDAPLPISISRAQAEQAVFETYRRYAGEIAAFLDEARPMVSTRARQPRKESERDLFSATG